MSADSITSFVRRTGTAVLAVLLCLPAVAFAQSPWERAASNLERTFTGPLARSLALVAIVIGGLMFMFGEAGAKRGIAGIVFGGGLTLFAAQFLVWLFWRVRPVFCGGPRMPDRPTYRPVYKALHRPLTIWGVDRRLFFLALLLGAATFNLFYSFLAGLLMFGGLYGFAFWATARDPEMLRILLASTQARCRYDPGKHEGVEMEVAPWW
jgi:type IV secretory pathway VirB2 component (pilin)/type IV secretory pathway TrbD component